MSLFINTSDKEKLIKYGFYYTKTSDNKYHKLEYMKRDDSNFDYMLLIAEWEKDEKTALLVIEQEVCDGISYITLEIPNIIFDLINEGLLQKG